MITDTLGIRDTGVYYQGKLIKVERTSDILVTCSYRWLYGIREIVVYNDDLKLIPYKRSK